MSKILQGHAGAAPVDTEATLEFSQLIELGGKRDALPTTHRRIRALRIKAP